MVERFATFYSGGNKEAPMNSERYHILWLLVSAVFCLWILGLVTSYTIGGFLNALLIVALVVLIMRTLSGRRPF